MDDLHLLHDGRLARLSGAEKEEFDLSKVGFRTSGSCTQMTRSVSFQLNWDKSDGEKKQKGPFLNI